MPDVVYFVASSVDGFIADADGSLDWLHQIAGDAEGLSDAFMASVGVQVMGSTTYEWLLSHEDLIAQPQKWNDFFGSMRTVVFSTRELAVPDGADIVCVSGAVAAHLAVIRDRAGDGVVWVVGGGLLAAQFLDAGLLDRVEVTVAPVVLGGGTPLFGPRTDPVRLRIRDAAVHGPFVHQVWDVA